METLGALEGEGASISQGCGMTCHGGHPAERKCGGGTGVCCQREH